MVRGEVRRRGRDPQEMTFTFDSAPESAIPTDASMLRQARERVANPEKFSWRLETNHRPDGTTRRTVIAERVVSYLHHGSLDVSPHEHFIRPESDPTFFAHSTFERAPPQPARGRQPARVPLIDPAARAVAWRRPRGAAGGRQAAVGVVGSVI